MGIDKAIRLELIARYPRIVSEKPIDRVVPTRGQQWVEIEARCMPAGQLWGWWWWWW